MVERGSYSISQCEGMYREFIETLKDVLRTGNSINLADFLKITPVVKGTFDGPEDGFKIGRNYVDIKTSLSRKFVESLKGKIKVSKVVKSADKAEITGFKNVKTEKNELCQHFINRLSGNFLRFEGYELSGIELYNCNNLDERLFIENDSLSIGDFNNSNMTFTILYSLEMPAWLTDGMEIYITLLYSAQPGNDALDYRTSEFLTKWKVL